jgi:hypothetical protein
MENGDMKPQHFHRVSGIFALLNSRFWAKRFWNFLKLLAEDAPVRYSEQNHNRAVVAKIILESFVPARERNQQREMSA